MSEVLSEYRPVWQRPKWWVGGVLAIILVVVLVCGIAAYQAHERALREAYERSQPEYVLRVLDQVALNHGADIENYSGYFTPKGMILWKWAASLSSETPHQSSSTTVGKPVIVGNTCDISISGADGTIMYARLLKGDRWQFDDMYFDTMDGKKVGIWASYMHDHPYMTMLKMNWEDLLGAFLKGVAIGASL